MKLNKLSFFAILIILVLNTFFVKADELLDCPKYTPIMISSSAIGAGLVYTIVKPNLGVENGTTFLTTVSLGAVLGAFVGAQLAANQCKSTLQPAAKSEPNAKSRANILLTFDKVFLNYDF